MESIVFENPLPDIPRYFTAIAEWMSCMVMIAILPKKQKGWRLGAVCVLALAVQSIFLTLTGNVPLPLWLPCMLAAVLLMTGFVFVCCRIPARDSVYYGVQAFMLAEFMASLEWQLYCWKCYDHPELWLKLLAMLLFYIPICLLYGWMLALKKPSVNTLDARGWDIIQEIALAGTVFAISNVSYYTQNTPFSSFRGEAVATIRTIMDFGGVVLLYAHYLLRMELHMQRELSMVKSLMQSQYLQYQQSRESIEVLNYKYHDLKHQIAALRSEEDPEKRSAFLNRMEEEIHTYEAQNKTGNAVLDTILTSKTMTCDKEGISLNCVADGERIGFMDVMDICSIVGNALDNAIEYERTVSEPEKRIIDVAIFTEKNFLIMRFENYFEGGRDGLEMRDGLPVTTKVKDREFHGYGVKSIRYTARKYGGAVSVDTKENWFELKVLVPMQMQAG